MLLNEVRFTIRECLLQKQRNYYFKMLPTNDLTIFYAFFMKVKKLVNIYAKIKNRKPNPYFVSIFSFYPP